ncbi:hypothetical protein NE237_013851 [Protea cynaroides]|uniref:Uncharacterized protein n=1 Tax=Protea cynaroides TaxID=273540 RepID=A0A9Q0H2H3_9MAGN|nr:hypothetical protein NE237_013851 [Protea cynaroides]
MVMNELLRKLNKRDEMTHTRSRKNHNVRNGEEEAGLGGLVEKIGTCLRRSRVGVLSRPFPPALPPIVKDNAHTIKWGNGELIVCGAYGRVYMGMNLDFGEVLAVKQVIFYV